MKVLVTGATGFTGSYVVPLLIERGFDVRCFARPTSNRRCLAACPVEWCLGVLEDQSSLERAMNGVDALVNIASLGFGHAPNIVGAAESAGVERAIFVSTTAIFTSLNAPSKAGRVAAENRIRSSRLRYTILRPTMIYGSRNDRNMCRLVRQLQRASVIPIPGNGRSLQQPVYAGDVAVAVAETLCTPRTIGRGYNISGRDVLTFDSIVDTIAERLGKRIRKVHLPAAPIIVVLKSFEAVRLRLPMKAEQIQRLNEDKVFDHSAATRDFDYRPRSFHEGLDKLLASMSEQRDRRVNPARVAA